MLKLSEQNYLDLNLWPLHTFSEYNINETTTTDDWDWNFDAVNRLYTYTYVLINILLMSATFSWHVCCVNVAIYIIFILKKTKLTYIYIRIPS